MVFLDGTTIRAHHKTAGAAKKGNTESAKKERELLADLAPRSASSWMIMAGPCLSRFRPVGRTNCCAFIPCLMICLDRPLTSVVIVVMPRTCSVRISRAEDLILSSRHGKMFLQSPVPNGLTGTGIWLKTYVQNSRNGGLLPYATKRQLRPSSSSFPLLPQQAISRPNRPWKTNAFGYRLFYKDSVAAFCKKLHRASFIRAR